MKGKRALGSFSVWRFCHYVIPPASSMSCGILSPRHGASSDSGCSRLHPDMEGSCERTP